MERVRVRFQRNGELTLGLIRQEGWRGSMGTGLEWKGVTELESRGDPGDGGGWF